MKDDLELAKQRAVAYIAHSPRTEHQVRAKLSELGYSEDITEASIEYLLDLKYIDDDAYAQTYAEQASAKYGPRMIEAKLRQRGISARLAQNASAVSQEAQKAAAARIIKRYDGLPEDIRRRRAYAALMRGGFDWDAVRGLFSEGEEDT